MQATSLATSQSLLTYLLPSIQIQRRRASIWGFGRKDVDTTPIPKNALTEEFLKRKTSRQLAPTKGDLAPSSIFEDEELAGPKPVGKPGERIIRNPVTMAAALDPDPRGRERWERKMLIRDIQKRGRLTKKQLLKKQEREVLSKSHDFKTSVKKLVPLAKQITGKTVDEAIIQMRFSKKKVAKDVREHLEHAKNEAIVRRGMGLGASNGQKIAPIQIQTKDGKRVKVTDPTTIYVEQAWVGRGLHTFSPEHRARGQINMLLHPTTSKFLRV